VRNQKIKKSKNRYNRINRINRINHMDPLKNIFSRPLLEGFGQVLLEAHPAFPLRPFLDAVFDAHWQGLELKQRVRHISQVLRRHLPPDYGQALGIVVDTAQRYINKEGEKLTFEYIFLPDFVECHGVEHPDLSIPAIETLTRWSSAEFAVRPFLLRYPQRMYAQMLEWSAHPSPMVRRLSSEGIRPRLPWGMGVPALKRDPAPIWPILENLKADPAETVRRSVANNLNDISKDHPAEVLALSARWLGQDPQTDWIVRHACRGLLKKGDAQALGLFGYQHGVEGLHISRLECAPSVRIGQRLEFSFALRHTHDAPLALRLEYAIDYRTASGKISTKVFKIKELALGPGQAEQIARAQRFSDFSTRKHYPGPHRLRVLANGVALAESNFEVLEG
jgi:3-methyladenine DNA glycosylase AlkC